MARNKAGPFFKFQSWRWLTRKASFHVAEANRYEIKITKTKTEIKKFNNGPL